MLQTAFLMVFEGIEGPKIVAGSTGMEEMMDKIALTKLTNRLFYKVGVGQERPQMELAGPITDEIFPESKILFFPLILQDPDSVDQRIREHGAISAIYLVFPSEEMNEIHQAYDELSRSLKKYVENIKTTKELIERFRSIEGFVNKAILRAALNRILNELLSDVTFRSVFVSSTDGTILALARQVKKKTNDPDPAERIEAISAMSISQRVVEVLENSHHYPLFLSQIENEAIIGIKIPEGGIFAFLERRIIYRGELQKKIDALRKASLKISAVLQREVRGLELFSLIRDQLPEVSGIMLMTKEGVALTSEKISGDPQELSGITAGFISSLLISIHDSQEVAVIEAQNSYILLGTLQKDVILLITVPKRQKLDEYIFKMQDLLESIRKEVKVDLAHYQISEFELSEKLQTFSNNN
ncbi:MAG: hypothetical protein ACFFAE_15815 [Candidatus Hodarchaeota archaeon]